MNTPYLNRYRNAEFLQYLKDILSLLDEQDKEVLLLTEKYNALEPLVNAIDIAFNQSQGSVISQELAQLDELRDDALTGLRNVITGYQYYYIPLMVENAKKLFVHINNYGANIQKLSYQEETAVLDSLITDWQTEPELMDAIMQLGLMDWVEYLRATNTEFKQKYLQRVEEQVANPVENIPELREQAKEAYRSLVEYVKAHEILNTAPQYSIINQQVSVLAGQYNQVVNNRANTTNTNPINTTETLNNTQKILGSFKEETEE